MAEEGEVDDFTRRMAQVRDLTTSQLTDLRDLRHGDLIETSFAPANIAALVEAGFARRTWKPLPGKLGQRQYLTITDAGRERLK